MSENCLTDKQVDIDVHVPNDSKNGCNENTCGEKSANDSSTTSLKQEHFVRRNYSNSSCELQNQRKRKPAWNSGNSKSKSTPFIICKDCGCAFKESKDRDLDEKKLRLVEIHENPDIDSCDIVFCINLQAAAELQWQGTSKVPCECQRCRKCRRRAPGDHYPDCECTLCQKRTAKCLNKEYYKMKYYAKCDPMNAGNEDNPELYARVCEPVVKDGIRCDCHDSVRILNAVHGRKCTCSKCMKFRRNYKQCCAMYARTFERRKAKQNQNLNINDDYDDEDANDQYCYKTLSELFPTVPQSCGHGPLCICPSQYKAAAANVTTYCRDETKPCLCHTYAPSNWDRVGPCDFQLCDSGRPRRNSIPVWDTTRESIEIDDLLRSSVKDTEPKDQGGIETKPKLKVTDSSKRSSNERKPSGETLTSFTFSFSPKTSDTSINKPKEKDTIKRAVKFPDPTDQKFQHQAAPKPTPPEQEQKIKSAMSPVKSNAKDKEVSQQQKKRLSIASSTDSKEPLKQNKQRRSSLTPSNRSNKEAKGEKNPSRTPSQGSKSSVEVGPSNVTAPNGKPNLDSKKKQNDKLDTTNG